MSKGEIWDDQKCIETTIMNFNLEGKFCFTETKRKCKLTLYSNWQYWHFQGSVKTNLYCRERGSEATGDRHINSESTMHLLAVACKLDCFYLTDLKNVIMNGLRQIVSYYKFHTGQSQSSGSCWSVSVFVWRSPILHKIHWIETRDQISDPEHSGNMYENL